MLEPVSRVKTTEQMARVAIPPTPATPPTPPTPRPIGPGPPRPTPDLPPPSLRTGRGPRRPTLDRGPLLPGLALVCSPPRRKAAPLWAELCRTPIPIRRSSRLGR